MATITWTSAVAGNWNTGSNWSGGVVPGSADDVVFDGTGSGDCTVDVNVDINSIYFNSYTGTFSASSFTFTVADYADADGTTAIIDLGSSSWTVGGNFLMRFISASSSAGTSSLTMTNTTIATFQWLTSGGNFNKLTLGPNANIAQGRGLTLIEAFILGDGATWQGNTYTPAVDHGCDLTLGANSSITFTTGKLWLYPDAGATRTGDPTATVDYLETRASAGDGVTWTIPQATYGGVKFRQNNSSQNGIWTFEGDTVIDGEVVTAMSKATNETIDTATNNVNLTLKGNVDITPSQGTITWSAGTGTITLAPTGVNQYDFNGQTIEGVHVDPDSLGTVTLTGNVTSSWLRDCGSLINLNGFTWTYDNVGRCAVPYNPPAPSSLLPLSNGPINDNLIGWWAFTDGSGSTAVDISTLGNDATQAGGVTWVSSSIGDAVGLDGTDDHFDTGTKLPTKITGTSPLSISVWVKMDAAVGNQDTLVGTEDNTGGAGSGSFRLALKSTGDARFISIADSSNYWYSDTSSGSATVGQWLHIVAVADAVNQTAQIYFNGVAETMSNITAGTAPTSWQQPFDVNVLFGKAAFSTGVRWFNGDLQNLRMWDVALTQAQVTSLYETPWIGSSYTQNTYFFPAHFGGRL